MPIHHMNADVINLSFFQSANLRSPLQRSKELVNTMLFNRHNALIYLQNLSAKAFQTRL